MRFAGLKRLLGAADYSKAGDRQAGLAAASEDVREAARGALSDLTLEHLYEHPLTDDQGRVDSVMRVNYDIDREAFGSIASLTLGRTEGSSAAALRTRKSRRIGRGLTGVMAAAVAKLCDVHELIFVAKKCSHPTQARTLLGAPGTLSSRLQPNHPTDDPQGIACLCYWGLSLGAGDALLGVNPAIDTVENVERLLRLLDALRQPHGGTDADLRAGPYQNAAGLPRTRGSGRNPVSKPGRNRRRPTWPSSISRSICSITATARWPNGERLRGTARQFMYFETGQGSEFTLRQASRHRHDDHRGPLLRPRANATGGR